MSWIGSSLRLWLAAGLVAGLGSECGARGGAPVSAAWQDPAYTPERTIRPSVAVLPVAHTGPFSERIDAGLEQVFQADPGVMLRARPVDIRQQMQSSRQLVEWVSCFQSLHDTVEELGHSPGLASCVRPGEMEKLQTLLDANLMVVPLDFTLQPVNKQTSGRASYRVYGLPSGKLLRQSTISVQVPETGESAEKRALVELLLELETDFSKHLL